MFSSSQLGSESKSYTLQSKMAARSFNLKKTRGDIIKLSYFPLSSQISKEKFDSVHWTII